MVRVFDDPLNCGLFGLDHTIERIVLLLLQLKCILELSHLILRQHQFLRYFELFFKLRAQLVDVSHHIILIGAELHSFLRMLSLE